VTDKLLNILQQARFYHVVVIASGLVIVIVGVWLLVANARDASAPAQAGRAIQPAADTQEAISLNALVFPGQTALTNSSKISSIISRATKFDIIAMSASVLHDQNDVLVKALKRSAFRARVILWSPTAAGYSEFIEALQDNAATKADEVMRALDRFDELTRACRATGQGSLEVRVLRSRPLLYNMWIADGDSNSEIHFPAAHITSFQYRGSRMSFSSRFSGAQAEDVVGVLRSEFEAAWSLSEAVQPIDIVPDSRLQDILSRFNIQNANAETVREFRQLLKSAGVTSFEKYKRVEECRGAVEILRRAYVSVLGRPEDRPVDVVGVAQYLPRLCGVVNPTLNEADLRQVLANSEEGRLRRVH
jgi:hypothetical protein